MSKFIRDAGKMLLGPLAGGTFYDSPLAKLTGIKDPTEVRRLRMEEEENKRRKPAMKRGGAVKKMAKGGSTASKRADGCATKGKTKGRFV